ncbi:hypothetical protein ACLMJK_002663 [Lecanora helva]
MVEKRKRVSEPESGLSECGSEESAQASEKKTKLEVSEPRTPEPLTEQHPALLEEKKPLTTANLALFELKMASSSGKDKTPIKNPQEPHTTESSSGKPSTEEVRQALEYLGMPIDEDQGKETKRGNEILKKAKALVFSQRNSPPPKKKLEKFVKQLKKEELSNEDSWIATMWWIIARKKRIPMTSNTGLTKLDSEVLNPREWALDNLRFRVNQEFSRGQLPTLKAEPQTQLAKWLAKRIGQTTPRPDVAYGLEDEAFTDKHMKTVILSHQTLTALSNGMRFPFFIIEFKSHDGSLGDAKNQACRGGAVIINVMDEMKLKAGMEDKDDDFDDGSLAFSLTMDPWQGEMWVHWRELREEEGQISYKYHMHSLKSWILKDETQANELRMAINNVLDWGVFARKEYLKTMLAKTGLGKATGSSQSQSSKASGHGRNVSESAETSDSKKGRTS